MTNNFISSINLKTLNTKFKVLNSVKNVEQNMLNRNLKNKKGFGNKPSPVRIETAIFGDRESVLYFVFYKKELLHDTENRTEAKQVANWLRKEVQTNPVPCNTMYDPFKLWKWAESTQSTPPVELRWVKLADYRITEEIVEYETSNIKIDAEKEAAIIEEIEYSLVNLEWCGQGNGEIYYGREFSASLREFDVSFYDILRIWKLNKPKYPKWHRWHVDIDSCFFDGRLWVESDLSDKEVRQGAGRYW